MSLNIQLQNPHGYPLDQVRLARAAHSALEQTGASSDAGLSIVITESDTLRQYNRQHRQIDAATDVLSFAAAPLPDAVGADTAYLGDIIIAYDYVMAQSEARGCCLSAALCLLVVHGTLHLMGHGHDSAAARARMWDLQAAALQSIGISPALVDHYAAPADG